MEILDVHYCDSYKFALATHPAIAMAAAVGQPDEYAGEFAVVYVTVKPLHEVESEILAAHARLTIPERAVPVRIEILPAMSLTAARKIPKPHLRLPSSRYVVSRALDEAGLTEIDIETKLTNEGRVAGGSLATAVQSLLPRLRWATLQ